MNNQQNWCDICVFLGINKEYHDLLQIVSQKTKPTNLDFYRPLFAKINEKLEKLILNAKLSFQITHEKQFITVNNQQFSTLPQLIAILNEIKKTS